MNEATPEANRLAPGESGQVPAGVLTNFFRKHLFDYNRAALVRWLTLALAGSAALGWALWRLATDPDPAGISLLIGLAAVSVAAAFPVAIPRTTFVVPVADVFVFTLLAHLGPAQATLAAGVEALIAVWRSSRRLSSRVSTPSAALAAMAVAGLLYEHGAPWLASALAWPAETARLLAIALVAGPYFALGTLPLLAVVAAKNNRKLTLGHWIGEYAWLAAVYLLSATAAGVLAMNARLYGAGVLLIAAAVTAATVALLQLTIRRQEAAHREQEGRIAEAQREAEQNQKRFMAAFTHAAIGMAIVRPDGRIMQVNLALCQLLRCAPAALIDRPFKALLHDGDSELFDRRFGALADGGDEPYSMELRCFDSAAQELWVSLHCSRFADPASHQVGWIYQLHDITSRRMAERELHHIAYHDSLTDLANRSCFNERLAMAVERSRVDMSHRFAVLFLDLDRFKVVNDSLGHIAGNQLLKEVAGRLSRQVRPGDLVARLGGDEFAVLLHHVNTPDETLHLAQRLLDALAAPVVINSTEVIPGASIGITLSDLGYRSADEVLRDADLAMYAAKGTGRNRAALFDATMHERIAEKLRLENDLRRAIGDGQLTLMYQPIFELSPYRLVGFEALARWTHPQRGAISPAVFIALAEESGHIESLTSWVIEQATAQLARWRASHPGSALTMHVNLSGRDLANPRLATHVCNVLDLHDVPPERLTLEITETTLMSNLQPSLDTLRALRQLGVKFSIDDFGTGYSSLAYLSTLPIDSLKIDRSFVQGLLGQPQNVEIVRAVLDLGRSLGKTVIAEGIETAEQLGALRDLGVPSGQGFLLSRPLRAEQATDVLQQHRTALEA